MELNSIYLNLDYDKAICSSLYEIFYIKDTQILCPEYLNLFIKRDEFARYCWFDAIGSARNYFRVANMQDIRIPLPSIEVQRELVTAYNGLKELAKQNEALLPQLSAACHAYIVDCRDKYPLVALGEYIEESDERNSDLSVKLSQGISNLKEFQSPKQVAQNSTSDKIVRHGYFGYNRATTRNGEKISIAYRDGEDCTVSSAYGVFYIKDETVLNPRFLMLYFKREEFDRFARWRSEGSAHEFFTFEMMKAVRIPLPPIEVQQAIVDVYHCMERAKTIATEARARLKQICPALIQRAAHT
jgi:type I restriction enzyme S subunit